MQSIRSDVMHEKSKHGKLCGPAKVKEGIKNPRKELAKSMQGFDQNIARILPTQSFDFFITLSHPLFHPKQMHGFAEHLSPLILTPLNSGDTLRLSTKKAGMITLAGSFIR